jgi:hypothetical protein
MVIEYNRESSEYVTVNPVNSFKLLQLIENGSTLKPKLSIRFCDFFFNNLKRQRDAWTE